MLVPPNRCVGRGSGRISNSDIAALVSQNWWIEMLQSSKHDLRKILRIFIRESAPDFHGGTGSGRWKRQGHEEAAAAGETAGAAGSICAARAPRGKALVDFASIRTLVEGIIVIALGMGHKWEMVCQVRDGGGWVVVVQERDVL